MNREEFDPEKLLAALHEAALEADAARNLYIDGDDDSGRAHFQLAAAALCRAAGQIGLKNKSLPH